MKPVPFGYERPRSVAEALDLKAAAGDDARFLAGGQSLGPMLNLRLARPKSLSDVSRLEELRGAGASPEIWEMVLQGSTGFSGSFARQVTLNANTATSTDMVKMLRALEKSAAEGAIELQGEGVLLDGDEATPVAVAYDGRKYVNRSGGRDFYRFRLLREAENGNLVLTLTARSGSNVEVDNPQPALWPLEFDGEGRVAHIARQTRTVELAFLSDDNTLRINGRHVQPEASVFIDGRRVEGEVRCETGDLPYCDDEILSVKLEEPLEPGGLRFLQLQNPGGLFSNDMMIFSEQSPPARRGNLITSGGAFDPGERQFDNNWNTVEVGDVVDSIDEHSDGHVHVNLNRAGTEPWHAQISHAVMVVGGQEYTLCYRARAPQGRRVMTAYMDSNMPDNSGDRGWWNISGGQFRANLRRGWQSFRHTFTVAQTDLHARVAFDFAQSSINVQIDDIGVYEGSRCGLP